MIKKIFYKAVYKKYVSLDDSQFPSSFICMRSDLFSFFWRIKVFRILIKKDAERFLRTFTNWNSSFGYSVTKEDNCKSITLFYNADIEIRKEFLHYMAFGK